MQLEIPEIAEGELYVGAVVDKDGSGHHVILLPGDNDGATWQAQMEWAKSVGGDLPNRIEQAMLWANQRDQFQKRAYWSNEQDDDPYYSGWAWYQYFDFGTQTTDVKSCELRARAVRRLPI
ncbi:DUF1566 domain-containing protein [Paraburkholderia sp. WP4_3_2]|uniref:DUF1566 domain-containing protein n=1 Tax=Paraburkholderia sp. WP4_3_2 TaxID=2587162 RepID=UPI001618A076|nr:DUF1566 domain-containing protein [Paraburkholderia sp. WP4_3_2]MBB3256901.1 hypothetical protein [Paraburkholderia sp. WP4_3_2]